jgi:hypothetical protein
LEERKDFRSFNTGKVYKIRQRIDCDSAWLIYLCSCKKCGGQYAGKSKTPFKLRHSNHKQEIKKKVGGLGNHYGGSGGCGYENISIVLIEEVEFKTFEFLAKRETYWQHQLRSEFKTFEFLAKRETYWQHQLRFHKNFFFIGMFIFL